MKRGIAMLLTVAATACADAAPGADGPAPAPPADAQRSAQPGTAGNGSEDRGWPSAGSVDYRRSRTFDFARDGSVEHVIVTAAGPTHDSLDVALTIRSAAGDTLWRETWPSLLYFNYDPLEGKADSTVVRIVQGHIEELLADSKFHPAGGLPPALSHADPVAIMRDAVRYHLAELDWRRAHGLGAGAPMPPDAHTAIDASTVSEKRVDSVLADVHEMPSFMYFAGGEATYAVAWSAAEEALVRIYACC